jgi:hypothetical protein
MAKSRQIFTCLKIGNVRIVAQEPHVADVVSRDAAQEFDRSCSTVTEQVLRMSSRP